MNPHYDVLIVGGGLVGCSLALGLSQLPLKVGLVDPMCYQHASKIDGKTIALSAISAKILYALCFGLTNENIRLNENFINCLKTHPIKTVHVSQQHRFGITRLKASDLNLPLLGYSIEIGSLLTFLYETLAKTSCHLISEQVKGVKRGLEDFEILLENKAVTTKLLIAADGDHSFLREQLKIAVTIHDYKQSALVTTVEITGAHLDTAFERFISDGSIALLPIAEKKMKLIWIASTDDMEQLTLLSSEALLSKLQGYMGRRLGIFHTLGSQRFTYPLKFQQALQQVQNKFVLMGNAAHALHPIAAQGFNLSLRDIAVLVEAIRQALLHQQEMGSEVVLQSYLEKRLSDQKLTEKLTHYLASGCIQDFCLGMGIRQIAFNVLTLFPSLRKQFTQLVAGYHAVLPRWV